MVNVRLAIRLINILSTTLTFSKNIESYFNQTFLGSHLHSSVLKKSL